MATRFSQAVRQRLEQREAVPLRLTTSTRINAINHGRKVAVPMIDWEMSCENLVLHVITVLGRFETPQQALLFGMTGVLRFGKITIADIIECEGRGGFFRRLDSTELSHLLSSRSLVLDINREKHRIILTHIGQDFDIEVIVDQVLPQHVGRRFR